jgi:hypothetical protein
MEKLPTKTKIAAWWMIVISGIGILWGIIKYIIGEKSFVSEFGMIDPSAGGIFLGLIFLICSLFLFKRKKWGWMLNIIAIGWVAFTISFGFFVSLFEKESFEFIIILFLFLLAVLFPLILLLLDRKNFWKVAK